MMKPIRVLLFVTVCSVIAVNRASATECTATITHVPDYVVAGEGTCVNGEIGTKSDVLTIDVQPRPACDNCKLKVTGTWGPGAGQNDSKEKSPSTDDTWPHDY